MAIDMELDRHILRRTDAGDEEIVVNFGPQHPSTHGVINFVTQTNGEVIRRSVPDVGYLHRGLEKIGEQVPYPGYMPFTDRIDYLAAMFANEGYAVAIERLLGVEVPPRAKYIRAIAGELCRISNHFISVGTMATDIGAATPLTHALRERETVNDLLEELCGARLTFNYHRIGGVAFDLPVGWGDKVLRFLDHLDSYIQEWDRLITFNKIFVKRLANVGIITREKAIDYGLAGPNLRGSGVNWDIRRDMPYGAYPDFEFNIPVGTGRFGTLGDCWDRYFVRVQEMVESSKIVRQALAKLPEGDIQAKVARKLKPDAGEAVGRVESARGEMLYYAVSDGSEKAYRLRVRTGSFMAMGIVEELSHGIMVADLIAIIASLDVVAPEVDPVKITLGLDSTSLTRRYPRLAILVTLFMAFGVPLGLYVAALAIFPLNTPERLHAMSQQWLGFDLAGSPYRYLVYTLFLLLVAFIAVNYTAVFGGVSTWVERRIAGRMQSRIGPNRTGAAGFLAWVADAVKMVLKEDTIPASADGLLFRGAPYFSMVGLLLPFVVLPFGQATVVTDMNVGAFYVTAVTAFVVVGILVSGWASNSKWALFGGIRGAAQVLSYEIPAGIALMVPVLMAGTLSMQGIVRAQGGAPWDWFVFRNPAAFVAFFIAVTSSLAEGNRTPFDLPEAESELVAGYHAEYSGFRLAIFLMVEWANMWIMGGLAVTMFLGGWQVPGITDDMYKAALGTGLVPSPSWFVFQALSMLVFAIKTWALVFTFIWLRWTLPRVRVDQMMSLCWKYLVPGAFLCFVVTLLWQLLVPPVGVKITGIVLTVFALALLVKFLIDTRRNIDRVKGDRVDLSNW